MYALQVRSIQIANDSARWKSPSALRGCAASRTRSQYADLRARHQPGGQIGCFKYRSPSDQGQAPRCLASVTLLVGVPDVSGEFPISPDLLPHHDVLPGHLLALLALGHQRKQADLASGLRTERLHVYGGQLDVADALPRLCPERLDAGSALDHGAAGREEYGVLRVEGSECGEFPLLKGCNELVVKLSRWSRCPGRRRASFCGCSPDSATRRTIVDDNNSKLDPHPGSNTEKPPESGCQATIR